VTSLGALRNVAKVSKAPEPFLGFGNPLLSGPYGDDREAWNKQVCAKIPAGTKSKITIAARALHQPSLFRGTLADVEQLRTQWPLPETADELCSVAATLGAQASAVNLGEQATEARVKQLSASGALAKARVVHFATHGLLAGETEMVTGSTSEPALMLTPPKAATDEDDGLLTASEVAQLQLDADWVVLSACNTASAGQSGGEDLSGLARAFFYAGARALLVSHWYVNSTATVELISRTFAALKAEPRIGRAEALRRAMTALISEDGGKKAHPSRWAPFIVVGEGWALSAR
jgi:CHAT domain-containing protein